MINVVFVKEKAKKQLDKAPFQVKAKFKTWQKSVEEHGIKEVRKILGYHDEMLLGNRKGQRSIRLNKQWRAIYITKDDGTIEFIEVMEVTPHEY